MTGSWWPAVRGGDLVAYLDDSEHARLLDAMEPSSAADGELVLRKGDPSASLLIVEDGELEVLDESLGEIVSLASVGRCGVVGEVGLAALELIRRLARESQGDLTGL